MRRCPNCQSPNPEAALFCARCGQGLPPAPRIPFWSAQDWWSGGALKAALGPLGVLLAFRLTFGSWLSVGLAREEWHYLAFHTLHGLLFGLALAWVRRERSATEVWRWVVVGLVGGFLAESLEYWYTYRHLMQGYVFTILNWYEGSKAALFPYQSLQALRLVGVLVPLGVLWLWAQRPRLGLQMASLLWVLAAVALRSRVLGYPLNWAGLSTALGWQNLALYAFSALAVLYAWGPRESLDAQP